MEALRRVGDNEARKRSDRVRTEYETWKKQVVDGIKNAESRAAAQSKAAEQFLKWQRINGYAVGQNVTITDAENENAQGMPAIVIEVSRRSNKGGATIPNPVAPSSWEITFAIPDMSRQLTMPFSQISTVGEEAATGIVMSPAGWTDSLTNLEKQFETASKEGKEERLIATGNLLAAYDQLRGKGQIIQFTDVNGNVQPGIIMPRSYSVEQFEKERRVKFGNSDQVMQFLDRSTGKHGRRHARDHLRHPAGRAVRVQRGRAQDQGRPLRHGQQRPPDLRRVVEAGRRHGRHRDKDKAQKLIAAMQAIGARFVAPSDADIANAIVHPEQAKAKQNAKVQNTAGDIPRLSASDEAKVREIVRRVAGIDPQILDEYIAEPDPAWGSTTRQHMAGFYDFVDDVLAVARLGGSRITAYHEAFHRLQNFFLNERERQLLNAMTGQLREIVRIARGDQADRMDANEIQTEAFALWSNAMDQEHPFEARLHIGVRRAWERLRQIIRAVREALGYSPTLRDVFAPARLGLTAQRTPLAQPYTARAYGFQQTQSSAPSPAAASASPLVPAGTKPRAALGAISVQRINAALRQGVRAVKTISPKDRRHRNDGEELGAYLTRKVEDYLVPLKLMQEAHGHNLNELNNAYMNARLVMSQARDDVERMHSAYVVPMTDALASQGLSVQDLDQFAKAMHAQERNEVVGARNPFDSQLHKAINDTSIIGASGWSTDQANQVLREFRQNPEKFRALREAHGHLRAMLNSQLRAMRSAGLISDETFHTLTTQWRNYVPLKGMEGIDEATGHYKPGLSGFDVRGDEYKTALGRFDEAENAIAHAIVQSEDGILRQHKNEVGKALLRFINEFDPEGQHVADVFWAGPDGIGDIVKADQVYKRTIGADGKVKYVRVPNPFSNRDDVIATKVGGKTYWIRFHDPKVGLALRKLSKWELGTFLKLIKPVTVWQTIVNTRANPVFIPRNIIRDALVGGIHLLDEGFSLRQIAGVMRNIPKAWRAIWRAMRNTATGDQWDQHARAFLAAGGKISFRGQTSFEETLKALEKDVSRKVNGQNPLIARWQEFKKAIGQLNDAGENGIRLAAFVAAREKQGRTDKEAAFMARELTVDFEQHGELGPAMNTLWVFANASLIGNMNILRRIGRSKKVRAAVGAAMLAGFLQHLWNYWMSGKDDDGESYYEKMLKNEPWKLERQFVFFLPGSDKYVSFPMPYVYNAFYHAGVQGGALTTGSTKPMSALADTLRVYFESMNPIGSGSLAQMISPTLTDPFVDLYLNRNVFGAPIYPEENKFDRSPDPKSHQAFSTTHPWFRKIAEGLNWATGGDEIMPGAIDIYPDALEHLWGYAVGGLGRFITNAEQTGEGLLRGDVQPEKVPWVSDFYGRIGEQSQKNQYYRMREEVLAAKGYSKSYSKTDEPGRADDFEAKHAAELEAAPEFEHAEKARKKINRHRRQLQNDHSIAAAERDRELDDLDKQELEVMRTARKAYIDAQKRGGAGE
jgi:hypothetical protein